MDRSTPLSGDRHFPTIGYYSIFNQIGDSENMEANNKRWSGQAYHRVAYLSAQRLHKITTNMKWISRELKTVMATFDWLMIVKEKKKEKNEDNGVWRWMCVTLE